MLFQIFNQVYITTYIYFGIIRDYSSEFDCSTSNNEFNIQSLDSKTKSSTIKSSGIVGGVDPVDTFLRPLCMALGRPRQLLVLENRLIAVGRIILLLVYLEEGIFGKAETLMFRSCSTATTSRPCSFSDSICCSE